MSAKSYAAGGLSVVGLQLFVAGTVFRFVPTTATIGPVARVLDSMAPWLLVSALLFSVFAVALGSLRLGSVLVFAILAGGAHLFVEHHSMSLPAEPDRTPDVRVLFFNALGSNTVSSQRIVSAALALDPDIIVFAERQAVDPALQRIQEAYTFISPCDDGACELLVASKTQPKRFWQLNLNPTWGKRYAVAEFAIENERSFFLAASHIAKPWLSGISESELAKLASQYNWFEGPVVAVGDFNAAPWSFPMRQLMNQTGMRGLRMPPATWPAKAGLLGLPIDQILVRGGVRITRVRPFGGDLGSNHRGFVADISLQ